MKSIWFQALLLGNLFMLCLACWGGKAVNCSALPKDFKEFVYTGSGLEKYTHVLLFSSEERPFNASALARAMETCFDKGYRSVPLMKGYMCLQNYLVALHEHIKYMQQYPPDESHQESPLRRQPEMLHNALKECCEQAGMGMDVSLLRKE